MRPSSSTGHLNGYSLARTIRSRKLLKQQCNQVAHAEASRTKQPERNCWNKSRRLRSGGTPRLDFLMRSTTRIASLLEFGYSFFRDEIGCDDFCPGDFGH
jgi:hypothetical protein